MSALCDRNLLLICLSGGSFSVPSRLSLPLCALCNLCPQCAQAAYPLKSNCDGGCCRRCRCVGHRGNHCGVARHAGTAGGTLCIPQGARSTRYDIDTLAFLQYFTLLICFRIRIRYVRCIHFVASYFVVSGKCQLIWSRNICAHTGRPLQAWPILNKDMCAENSRGASHATAAVGPHPRVCITSGTL